jgi:4-hydroxy-2-oxoheptanedioate aldolase
MKDIRNSIAEGAPSFGVWSSSGSPVLAEIAGRAGMDWVIIDTQHGAVGDADLLGCVQAVQLGGSPVLVRVGANDSRLIMRALDLGAAGVVVPLVSTPKEAASAVAACRYPPRGNRSFGPVRGFYSGGITGPDPLCLVMIETAAGLEAIDDIVATPGLDGVFIGPVDLGLDLGFGMADFARLNRLRAPIEKIVAAVKGRGVIAGAASLSDSMTEEMLEMGFDLLTVGTDVGHVARGFRADSDKRVALLSRERPK